MGYLTNQMLTLISTNQRAFWLLSFRCSSDMHVCRHFVSVNGLKLSKSPKSAKFFQKGVFIYKFITKSATLNPENPTLGENFYIWHHFKCEMMIKRNICLIITKPFCSMTSETLVGSPLSIRLDFP